MRKIVLKNFINKNLLKDLSSFKFKNMHLKFLQTLDLYKLKNKKLKLFNIKYFKGVNYIGGNLNFKNLNYPLPLKNSFFDVVTFLKSQYYLYTSKIELTYYLKFLKLYYFKKILNNKHLKYFFLDYIFFYLSKFKAMFFFSYLSIKKKTFFKRYKRNGKFKYLSKLKISRLIRKRLYKLVRIYKYYKKKAIIYILLNIYNIKKFF